MTSGPAGSSLQDDVRANPFVADAKVRSRGCRSTRPATGILRATRVPSRRGTASNAYTDGEFSYLTMTMTATPTLTAGRDYLIGF